MIEIGNTNLCRARQLLELDDVRCVFVLDNQVIERNERGVIALLDLLDERKSLAGFAAADKVVGKAAASLYVLLGVTSVYGETMSKAGKTMLESHGIECCCSELVEQMMNRDRTGICPMEAAVSQLDDVRKAPKLLKAAIEKMRK